MAAVGETSVRDRIIETASAMLRDRGYAAASMRDIVEAAQAPRGSLQHYFPGGKTELASEAIALGRGRVGAYIDTSFTRSRTAHGAVRWFFERSVELLVESDYAFGCPLATVALEQAGLQNEIAAACQEAFDDWIGRFAAGFVGHGVPARQATRLGTITLSQYEGAMILARVGRNAEPLRTASGLVVELLQQATP